MYYLLKTKTPRQKNTNGINLCFTREVKTAV